MGFKAADAAGALDWDFRPFVDAHGTTPEPDGDAVADFQFAMREATAGLIDGDVDPSDPAAMARALDKLSREDFKASQDGMLDAVAELTDGSPTREQIAALPYRHQKAYLGSLMGDLLDPTPAKPGTRRSPVAGKRA